MKKNICDEKDKFKKFIRQEMKFLKDVEWFVGDHMISTKRRLAQRRRKLEKYL